mgnify:CR=1 FL=1
MFPPSSIGDIAQVIQLAIVPVFLLTGVGTLLALTGCLIVFLREIFLAVTSARRTMPV